MVDVDYLAFYQPGSFGSNHRWMVEFAVEVRGHELTTRRELFRDEPDHPRANEEYYKIQLGSLIRLENPIKAGAWKRLTFLYTFGSLFNRAETMEDLILKSEQRQILWKTIRDRMPRESGYLSGMAPEMDVDASILAFFDNINLFLDPDTNNQDKQGRSQHGINH